MNDNNRNERYRRIGLEVFRIAAAVCILIFLLMRFDVVGGAVKKVFDVLTPIWLGVILCFLANPLYRYMLRKADKKETGSVAAKIIATGATLVGVAMIVAFICLICRAVYQSVGSIIEQAPGYLDNLGKIVENFTVRHPEFKDAANKLYASLVSYLENFVEDTLMPNLNTIASSLFSSVKSLAAWVYNILIGVIAMVYLLNVRDAILPKLKKLVYALFKKETADTICSDISDFTKVFGGYVSGKLLDSLIIGIICLIFSTAVGMPYNILVSIIVGVTNIIPYLGPFIGAIPSALLILMIDPKMCLVFIVFIIVLQQLDGNVIGPKILGKSTGVSSFGILVAVILFGGLFGLAGMVFSVPLWALVTGLIERAAKKALEKKGLPTEDTAYARGGEPDKESEGVPADRPEDEGQQE